MAPSSKRDWGAADVSRMFGRSSTKINRFHFLSWPDFCRLCNFPVWNEAHAPILLILIAP